MTSVTHGDITTTMYDNFSYSFYGTQDHDKSICKSGFSEYYIIHADGYLINLEVFDDNQWIERMSNLITSLKDNNFLHKVKKIEMFKYDKRPNISLRIVDDDSIKKLDNIKDGIKNCYGFEVADCDYELSPSEYTITFICNE